MTSRLLKEVAKGNVPPSAIDEPFQLVSESCSSPYISHDTHWVYWAQFNRSFSGQFSREFPITEDTAKRIIELYGLEMHLETHDRLVYSKPELKS